MSSTLYCLEVVLQQGFGYYQPPKP